MLWLAVHFPMLGFEVQRENDGIERADVGLGRPEPARKRERAEWLTAEAERIEGRPTILIHDNRVAQIDARAEQAGIAIGSTLATAHGIAPELVHFPLDQERMAQQLEVLGQAAYRFSSRVSLAAPDALLLESRGSLRLFGGLSAFCRAVSGLLAHLGHEHHLATAPTPLAALILARCGLGHPSQVSSHEEPSAGRAPSSAALLKQDPMIVVRDAPLAAMDLTDKELERLANMGMTRIGQLLDLPLAELGKRFSASLVDELDRLTGRRADPRLSIKPAERFHAHQHLLDPIRGKDALLFPMQRLAERLSQWLNARCLGVRILIWTYAPFAKSESSLEVRLASPRTDAKTFLKLTQLQLERTPLPDEVVSVALRAEEVIPVGAGSDDLLTIADVHQGITTSELVDQLTARLGSRAISGLGIVDDHRPERAWRKQVPGKPAIRRRMDGRQAEVERDRPLWLLEPPRHVRARDFKLLNGPERLDVGWWDGEAQAVERDYFVAVAKTGARCWLFRDSAQRWFLHGLFS